MTVGGGARRKGKEKGLGYFCDISGEEIRNWIIWNSRGKEEEVALLWIVLRKESRTRIH